MVDQSQEKNWQAVIQGWLIFLEPVRMGKLVKIVSIMSILQKRGMAHIKEDASNSSDCV